MIDHILTNYDNKFVSDQLDHETIHKSKLYIKIYNNKVSEPLQKFWFSVSNLKYYNNYSNYKTIRFLLNNKNQKSLNLINFIKDIGNNVFKKINNIFQNVTIDYPWKEHEQYPIIFSFFTNNSTLLCDSNNNNISFESLSSDNTYSIIFEISNIRILPINLDKIESYAIKINLTLLLIKTDEKKDLNNNLQNNFTNVTNNYQNSKNCSDNYKLPFLGDIQSNILSLKKENSNNKNLSNSNTNLFCINQEQLVNVKKTLKKVNTNIDTNNKIEDINNIINNIDNSSNNSIKPIYIEQKKILKKVKTEEKSLLTHLKKKKNKKLSIIKLEEELEKELQK